MGDEGLSGLLPKAPPPRPARREAAIAAAMRRFDGIADAPAEPQHMPARPPLWKSRWGRAGASILLVAMLTVSGCAVSLLAVAVSAAGGEAPALRVAGA
ncbi:hypothetical protein BRX39_20030, partial [Sphingomonas koreensis]